VTTEEHVPAAVVDETSIPGPYGSIPIRVYRPAQQPPLAGVVWLHGGAFIGGDLDMAESEWVAHEIAGSGLLVITVDYRLAPTPAWMAPHVEPNPLGWHFPVASEEVSAAFIWASQCDAAVPLERWTLGGASAGGNLAAGAAMRLRDAGGPAPGALVLAYPLLHKELPPMSPELEAKYETLPINARFSPETVAMINLNYVEDHALLEHPYAFPGGHDLRGLPPTLIVNSDVDSLRASGELFASELAAAAVDTTVLLEPETHHGHLNQPETDGARRTVSRMTDWLRIHAYNKLEGKP
jgi:acetyl esterase/lipase